MHSANNPYSNLNKNNTIMDFKLKILQKRNLMCIKKALLQNETRLFNITSPTLRDV